MVIVLYALGSWAPMADLFFWLGTTGGLGILILLALTSVAVIRFFDAGSGARTGETLWARMIAPAVSAISLAFIVVLAVMHYATLLGVVPGSPAAWLLPASFAVAAVIGLGWAGRAQIPSPRHLRRHRARPSRDHRLTRCRQPAHDYTRRHPKCADHRVESAGRSDVDLLSSVIAGAFFDLAVSQWLIPDPSDRRAIFPSYFRIHVDHALATGLVLTTPARDAAALWILVGAEQPDEPPEEYRDRIAALAGPNLARFQALDEAFGRHHPAGVPHEHLAILAVRPGRQRLGIGTALLNARHAILDRDGTSAYLEASDLAKREIYRAHGYVDLGEPIQLSEGPEMYPMWRFPRGGAGNTGRR